jgi:hypothetical protein
MVFLIKGRGVRCCQHSFTSGACADAEPKIYTQITDMAALVRVMEEYLEDYNSITTSPMRLVTFLDAAEHVARVARILRTPEAADGALRV